MSAFSYDNRKFKVQIALQNADSEKTNETFLLEENVGTIQYTNELNNLILTGSVEYTDTDARVDKFLDKTFVNCSFSLDEVVDESDGDIVKTTTKALMAVTMFVSSIGILENSPGKIKYKLFLISNTWTQCQKNVSYTNYDKSKEGVFDIAKILLKQANFRVDEDSFIKCGSTASLNYITDNNDNIVTSLRYLFNKMCYSSEYGIDSSVKGIVYDEHNNIVRAFDTEIINDYQNIFNVTVNQMKTNIDPVSNTGVNLAYNVKQDKVSVMKTMFANKNYSYSIDTNSFSSETIDSQQILNYYHGHNDHPRLNFIQKNSAEFWKSQMIWNNNINNYWDQVKNLRDYGGLILNTPGKIGVIPGWRINVNIPIEDSFITGEDKKQQQTVQNSYQAMCGVWLASSVTTFINPKDMVFRQNIQLMRNIKVTNLS